MTLLNPKNGQIGKPKPERSSGLRTKTLGCFTRCHWSTSHPHSLTKWGQYFFMFTTPEQLQRLRSDKLHSILSWIPLINFSELIYSSSFRITIEGPILLLLVETSLADQMELSPTRFSRRNYSQTSMTHGLKIGWQTLITLILFTEEANFIWHFFDDTRFDPASFIKISGSF